MWQAVAGSPIGDELLEWPPDVFALTDVILERAEAYRFVFSPPAGVLWPPVATQAGATRSGRQHDSGVYGLRIGMVQYLKSWPRSGVSFGSGPGSPWNS